MPVHATRPRHRPLTIVAALALKLCVVIAMRAYLIGTDAVVPVDEAAEGARVVGIDLDGMIDPESGEISQRCADIIAACVSAGSISEASGMPLRLVVTSR